MNTVTVTCPNEACEEQFEVEYETWGAEREMGFERSPAGAAALLPCSCESCGHVFTVREKAQMNDEAMERLAESAADYYDR